jgi:hypothetical protein
MPLPAFIINMRDSPINMTVAKNWTLAYTVSNVLLDKAPDNITFDLIIKIGVRMAAQLYEIHTYDELQDTILAKYN